MKRIFLIFLIFLMAFTASCKKEEKKVQVEAVTCFLDELSAEDADARAMQRKIAAWYNLNWNADDPDPGFERAYNSILYYTGGIMGYVVFPEQGQRIPIGHGYMENGFAHDSNSSFPIGGEGNHALLHMDQPMELKEGDRFYICILGDTLVYCVGAQGQERCTLVCGENRYEASRVVED